MFNEFGNSYDILVYIGVTPPGRLRSFATTHLEIIIPSLVSSPIYPQELKTVRIIILSTNEMIFCLYFE